MLRTIGILQDRDRTRLAPVLGFVLAFFSIASVAKANTVSMEVTGVAPGNTVTLNVSDGDATPIYSGVNAYIDPYVALVNGSPTLIWCVDPDHEATLNTLYSAYVSLPGDVTHTYLSSATTYGEMAFLVTELQGATNTLTKQELQAAIWFTAEGETTANTGEFLVNGMSTSFYDAVNYDIAHAGVLSSGYEILTDKAGKEQEFLVLVPEPSTLLLLGVGLFGFIMLCRSKMARPLIG